MLPTYSSELGSKWVSAKVAQTPRCQPAWAGALSPSLTNSMTFATATIQPAADSVESDCNPTQARRGRAGQGKARLGAARQARRGEDWYGKARQARRGAARLGAARQAGRGLARQARRGEARRGLERQARRGQARRGKARQGRLGMARRGEGWLGKAGWAWRGMARHGGARQGRHSTNRSDRAGYKLIAKQQTK